MIVLENYSKVNTYITITPEGYSVIDANRIDGIEHGIGGFTDDNEFLGLYMEDDHLYFQYNDNKYETEPDEIICTNERFQDGKRNFKVKIKDTLVCDIVYQPYVNPFALIFGDDEDEFDFLLHLSELMKSEESLLSFIKGIHSNRKV